MFDHRLQEVPYCFCGRTFPQNGGQRGHEYSQRAAVHIGRQVRGLPWQMRHVAMVLKSLHSRLKELLAVMNGFPERFQGQCLCNAIVNLETLELFSQLSCDKHE